MFYSTDHSLSLREVRTENEGRNLQAGTEGEAIEEHYSLACPQGLHSLLCHTPQGSPQWGNS